MEEFFGFLGGDNLKTTLETGTLVGALALGVWTRWREGRHASARVGLVERQLLAKVDMKLLKKDEKRKHYDDLYKALKAASPAAERVISRLMFLMLVFGVVLFLAVYVVVFSADWSEAPSALVAAALSVATLLIVLVILWMQRKAVWNWIRGNVPLRLRRVFGVSSTSVKLVQSYLTGIDSIQRAEEEAIRRRIDDALLEIGNGEANEL